MLTTIIRQTIDSYRYGILFFTLAFPLVLIAVLGEGFQHIVEFGLGMFTAGDGISDGAETYKRLGAGLIKVMALLTTALLVPRYFLHGRSIKKAFGTEPNDRRLLGFIVIGFGVFIITVLLGGPLLTDLLVEHGAPIPAKLIPFTPVVLLMLLSLPFHNKMIAGTAAAFGDRPFSPDEEKRYRKEFNYGFLPLLLLTLVPAIGLHYWFSINAVGQSGPIILIMLALDSLVVGLIAALMGASLCIPYRDVRAKEN